VLLQLAYLGVTNALAMPRLLPMSDRAKDAEILALRHQIMVLQRQLGGAKVRFTRADRALLAALLHRLPRAVLHRIRLPVRPETVLRWHRDLIAARHARISRPKQVGRPPTVRSIRQLVLRLARANNGWGYRRIHGELLVLGVKVAASTVWEILREAGIDPAPERTSTNWAVFLRSQAEAILAADFFDYADSGIMPSMMPKTLVRGTEAGGLVGIVPRIRSRESGVRSRCACCPRSLRERRL
jgi:putative transposase